MFVLTYPFLVSQLVTTGLRFPISMAFFGSNTNMKDLGMFSENQNDRKRKLGLAIKER